MIYPWQQAQWKLITSQWKEGKLPHALLFCGQEGMGKYDFSISVAKRVLCLAPQKEIPCEDCRSCQLFESDTHPDFYDISLEEKSKSIKIDQIRDLVHQFNQSSHLGGYRVAIIHPAETMNRFAANALLKTLEEPAGDALFILIADQPARLLPTIHSRCQKMVFSAKEEASTLQWLSGQLDSHSNPSLLLAMAENAPLKALELANLNYLAIRNELLNDLVQLRKKQLHPIKIAENYLKQDTALLLLALISLLLDITRLQLNATRIVNQDCVSELKNLSQSLSWWALQHYLIEIVESRKLLLSAIPVNVQLLLENLLLEWMKLPAC